MTLKGTVDAYWKTLRAENLVSQVRGVIDVENRLSVVLSGSFVDKDIATDIEAALERSVHVDAGSITVKVERGRVALTGTVPTFYGRVRAYDATVNTPGVIAVDNNIAVIQ